MLQQQVSLSLSFVRAARNVKKYLLNETDHLKNDSFVVLCALVISGLPLPNGGSRRDGRAVRCVKFGVQGDCASVRKRGTLILRRRVVARTEFRKLRTSSAYPIAVNRFSDLFTRT